MTTFIFNKSINYIFVVLKRNNSKLGDKLLFIDLTHLVLGERLRKKKPYKIRSNDHRLLCAQCAQALSNVHKSFILIVCTLCLRFFFSLSTFLRTKSIMSNSRSCELLNIHLHLHVKFE